MPRPIVCLDFDGTLVDSGGKIHPRDVEVLSGERGAIFLPVTGRPLHSVRHVLERHGLFVREPIPIPLVLMNGGATYRAGEKLNAVRGLPPDVQEALIDAALARQEISYLFFSLTEVHVLWPTTLAVEMSRRFDLNTQEFTRTSREQSFIKLMCVAPTAEALDRFVADTATLPIEPLYSLPTVLEINPAGTNKGEATTKLLSQLHLDGSEIIAAGDGENDFPLFELAARCFVPDTSPPETQAQACGVIDVREQGLLVPILESIGLH